MWVVLARSDTRSTWGGWNPRLRTPRAGFSAANSLLLVSSPRVLEPRSYQKEEGSQGSVLGLPNKIQGTQ